MSSELPTFAGNPLRHSSRKPLSRNVSDHRNSHFWMRNTRKQCFAKVLKSKRNIAEISEKYCKLFKKSFSNCLGPRGREFEPRHSDQKTPPLSGGVFHIIFSNQSQLSYQLVTISCILILNENLFAVPTKYYNLDQSFHRERNCLD